MQVCAQNLEQMLTHMPVHTSMHTPTPMPMPMHTPAHVSIHTFGCVVREARITRPSVVLAHTCYHSLWHISYGPVYGPSVVLAHTCKHTYMCGCVFVHTRAREHASTCPHA